MKYVTAEMDQLLAVPHQFIEQYQPRLRCCGKWKYKMSFQQATGLVCMVQDSFFAYLVFYRAG